MKIGFCLLVREEIDIIADWFDFYKDKFDFLVVTDNKSADGTREFLNSCNDINVLIDEPEQNYNQKIWVERMIDICVKNDCTHVAVIDADEFWHVNFKHLAEKMEADEDLGAYKLKCKLYVPTVFDDNEIKSPTKRMQYYVKKGRNKEESDCIKAWRKVFFQTKYYKKIEIGNDNVFFTKKLKIELVEDENTYIYHYPLRSWKQFRNKIIVGGEAWYRNKNRENFGWHICKIYDIYFKENIVGLKKYWYSIIWNCQENLVGLPRG